MEDRTIESVEEDSAFWDLNDHERIIMDEISFNCIVHRLLKLLADDLDAGCPDLAVS